MSIRKPTNTSFDSALKATLNDEISVTENGACGFKTSGRKLLDINFAVSSLRNKTDAEVEKMFSEAFYENPLLACKWLFMLRDVRQGMGERKTFRTCFKWLATVRPDIVKELIGLCSEYGRYDDLFCLLDVKDIEADVLNIIDTQWSIDIEHMRDNKSISLLAKWMPSITTSSPATVKLAKYFVKKFNISEKQYRQTLSNMRRYLNVVEQKMSAKEWSDINYETVPSKANLKYRNAFLRNDEARRREFLGKLEKGEAKINSAANFPSDIVHAYTNRRLGSFYHYDTLETDAALEAMWKALPDYVKDQQTGSTIVVADGSGSMECSAGSNSSITCLEVANALAIYFAEKLEGQFKDKYITFSEHPQYVDMSNAKTLAEKLNIAYQHDECANTNVEAVFDLLLETATRHNLKQEEIPSNVLVVSDMEYDEGTSWGDRYYCGPTAYAAKRNALFESIKQKWSVAGYKLPRLVFWNVNSRSGTIPLQENEMGVALVSGYSPAIANMVFSAKLDPYEALVDALNVPRYQPVEDATRDILCA